MKNILIYLLLSLTSITCSAATVVLSSYPDGLKKGTYSIDYSEMQFEGICSSFHVSGVCIIDMPGYGVIPGEGLEPEISRLNSDLHKINEDYIISDLNINLTCSNRARVNYHFETEQLATPGQILLDPPTHCG